MPPSDQVKQPAPRDLAMVARFAFVGITTAGLSPALVYILVEFAGIHTTPSSFLAITAAGVYNYVMHYHWTFSTDAPHGVALAKYLTMAVSAIVLSTLIMHFGVQLTNLHYLVIQIATVGILVLWSLTLSSLWIFR